MAAAPERARHSRMLSFTSNKSDKSSKTSKSRGSKIKVNLVESHKEKEANRVHTHADPTLAISELQPSAIAQGKSNLESLRGIQHKDRFGNVINCLLRYPAEPDLSNPTRHRFERPLDTIRAFEAAVDGTYNSRRLSYVREDSVNGQSRPTSYFGDPRGNLSYPAHNFNNQNGYFNNRGFQRRDSQADAYGGFNYNQHNNYNDSQAPRPSRHTGRSQTDPWGHSPNGHAQQSQYQTYDSGSASGSGNHSLDQLAQSTDPSSLASSREGLQQQQQLQPQTSEVQIAADYGFAGFGTDPQLVPPQGTFQPASTQPTGANGGNNGALHVDTYASQALAPPAPPAKDPKQPEAEPVSKNSFFQKAKGATEKRKSWFKRLSKS
ncbi:predicted protein [Uncinocarpus reesii 1704]|uniref:Uncharacterized protein n=1 Tax=Uncinocarpus reesii (strain UAMH 1704) TaxID=336963 RepID=C4JZP6_UNCRE|nr:uncharacterized protein UREG_07647 [Uncinocarpus reesii 1704]EEP82782.1 predicted protein [Uncinocarpus reesii 1704]